jgi:DNA-binding response OmpR family regulator
VYKLAPQDLPGEEISAIQRINPEFRRKAVYLALILGQRGHVVRQAVNLAQARAELRGDLDLPDGSGLELMREIGRGDGVPGIAMSGLGSEEDLRLSREAGFAIHLTKPIEMARLDAAIRQLGADADRHRPIAEACP